MNFRWRLLLAFLAVVLLPMIALALFMRSEMTERLTAQYERRVESLIRVIENDLAEECDNVGRTLVVLRDAVAEDNRFRRAVVGGAEDERRYVLDYAEQAMRLAGLSMLQIQDESGRIVSSGHFRNEYDRLEPELPKLLGGVAGAATLVQARAPEAPFLALARVDSFRMGSRRFTIVGGVKVNERFLRRLARDADMTVSLEYPGGVLSSAEVSLDYPGGLLSSVRPSPSESPGGEGSSGAAGAREIVRTLAVSFVGPERDGVTAANFSVVHDLAGLQTLRSSIDRWFLMAVAAAGLIAVVVVTWLASRMSRPLAELADKTSRIDLDRLDIDFDSSARDEIGVLSRVLGAMTERLRASAVMIKDAERRATVGELARQVNHDIKNGLTPIRNVFRHLSEIARDRPTELGTIFREREGTVDSSISYLEKLAGNYARLSVRGERRPCDVNEIARRVAADRQSTGAVRFRTDLSDGAVVMADPLSLRRILENLTDNAVDSLQSRRGEVTIETVRLSGEGGAPHVRLTVSDTGVGMSEDEVAKIFDDFYTTKPQGTGLGLSVVRRLVMDLGGAIRVESEKGEGSRFIIELPAEETS